MKVLQTCVCKLSNMEVYNVVKEGLGDAEKRRSQILSNPDPSSDNMADVETHIASSQRLVEYFERCYPGVKQIDESTVGRFLEGVVNIPFTDDEVLHILNMTPCDPVFLHGMCRNCDSRFTEKEVDFVCCLIQYMFFGGPSPEEAPPLPPTLPIANDECMEQRDEGDKQETRLPIENGAVNEKDASATDRPNKDSEDNETADSRVAPKAKAEVVHWIKEEPVETSAKSIAATPSNEKRRKTEEASTLADESANVSAVGAAMAVTEEDHSGGAEAGAVAPSSDVPAEAVVEDASKQLVNTTSTEKADIPEYVEDTRVERKKRKRKVASSSSE
eukprot:TRINITY_DN33440_c0_g1_i1.p1 TRINITY_DN33440_c0_g1~~TRINITY_DN33440_c0_g1_i1.p1  ORF type:complete len:342 (+),score=66.63 TRINITY_DN33440_c0_g1_i1:36-1028(+)